MLRKKYRLSIDFLGRFGRPKAIEFVYEQGTLRGLLEITYAFKRRNGGNEWLFDFLMKNTEQSDRLTRKLFDQLGDEQVCKISDFILSTYGKSFFKGTREIPSGHKKDLSKVDTSFSMVCMILEKTSETMESLLDMTWEQFEYVWEGIVWNVNAANKGGRASNDKARRESIYKTGSIEEDLKIAQEFEKKLKNKSTKNA